jgi:hypothetical protein
MQKNCFFLVCLILGVFLPLSSAASTQKSAEAEAVAGGLVIADPDASGSQAVTRTSDGIYTWWVMSGGNVPHGDYVAFVRARTTDGTPHTFTDLAFADETQIATLPVSVDSKAYRWYRLGEFTFSGSTLRLADWSDASLVIDKVIIEPVQVVNAKDVSGGTAISDSAATSGTAVTRTVGGIYTWWGPSTSGLPHGTYSLYVRARTQGVSSATFTEHVTVNGTETSTLSAPVTSDSYQWIPVGSFEYRGSTLLLADYSNAGLAIDQVRLVQDRPMDPTLGLYHLWYGNAGLSGVLNVEAESVAGGTVIDDLAASSGRAVSLSASGIYVWWNVPIANLVSGAQYSIEVRMRSMDGGAHNFGLYVSSQDNQLAHQDVSVSSSTYQWYTAVPPFQYNGQGLMLSDWSDSGLAVDTVRVKLLSPQGAGYQLINFYQQGSPGTPGITSSPGRLSVLPQDNGETYGYFRQSLPNDVFDQHMGISSDGGVTFEVQPSPIISVTPNQNVPGFGLIVTAYDGSAYKTDNGYYLVFEGAGNHPFSSMLAYSQDGVHNWSVQGALVTPPSYTSSASTPNVIQDVESKNLYLQWVNLSSATSQTTRHQAAVSYLQSWNSQASWPSSSAIWTDPTFGALQQSSADAWDAENYGAGSVIYEDGYYYMSYEGADAYNCSGTWGLGLARIAQGNLANSSLWEKSPLNPMLKAFDSGSCWIGYPQIAKIGGGYYLYYSDPEVNWTPTNINNMYRRAISINSN